MPNRHRLLALFLCLCLVCGALSSCAGGGVLSYGSQSLDERFFTYLLTMNKTQTLAALYGTTSSLTDNAEIWSSEAREGVTYGEAVVEETLNTLKMTLFYCDYAEKNGLSLSAEERAAAEKSLQSVVSSFESRAAFDAYMKPYGFDYDLLRRYYELDALSSVGMRAYYQYPATALTQADVRSYYADNFVTLLFYYANETDVTLPNGKVAPLTEEEAAARRAAFDAVETAVRGGAPLSSFLEDSDFTGFESGEAETVPLSSVTPSALATALSQMEEDSLQTVTAGKGRYLIWRAPLDDAYFEENQDALLLAVLTEREEALLAEHEADFLLSESFFSSLDVASLPIF